MKERTPLCDTGLAESRVGSRNGITGLTIIALEGKPMKAAGLVTLANYVLAPHVGDEHGRRS